MLLDLLKRKKQKPVKAHGATKAPAPAAAGREHLCEKCSGRFAATLWESALHVCPACGHHGRIGARARLTALLDADTFQETGMDCVSGDPLAFPGYPEKLAQAAAKSGERESVITGTGRINGQPAALFVMEPDFMMGSLGSAAGERIASLVETALEAGLPVIGICASGGARMQEGILSLMQMAKTAAALGRLSEARLPYIVLLTDPTTGGVTASFAMLGDVILAEPGALIGFAGQRVIEQTLRQSLPPGFQRAEFLMERGFVDRIVPRGDLRRELGLLIRMHTGNGGGRHGTDA